jgi:hypothetical protein
MTWERSRNWFSLFSSTVNWSVRIPSDLTIFASFSLVMPGFPRGVQVIDLRFECGNLSPVPRSGGFAPPAHQRFSPIAVGITGTSLMFYP